MRSNWTKAAAAALLLAGGLSMLIILRTASTGYALDQTVEANDHVTSYHAKFTPAREGVGEVWAEMGPDGTAWRLRMNFPKTEDGAKVTIVSGDRAEVWFKNKKIHFIACDKDILAQILKMRVLFDPKLAFEQLQEAKKAGKAQVETQQPTRQGEPITLTVTSEGVPNRREVYEVDPETKLVKRVVDYQRRGDQWKQVQLREYLDYNKPIDPKVFEFELPEGVITLDQMNREVGLAKGELSDEEMAKKVVREFFEALIAKDYKKAGIILGGLPAEAVEKGFRGGRGFGEIKFLRIVEIGQPMPHHESKSFRVPVKVETKVKGEKKVQGFSPYVRSAYKQPNRWVISGGI